MKKLICLVLFFVLFVPSQSKDLKFYFKNLHRAPREGYESIKPLYKFYFDTLKVDDKYFPIKLLDVNKSDTEAFAMLFFTGRENAAHPRITYTLFKNYKIDTIQIYPDINGNLDFTDDSISYKISNSNPFTIISLPNSKNPGGKFYYKIGKVIDADTSWMNRVIEYFYNDDKSKGFITTDPKYWYSETRLNVLSCDTIINGDSIQLGLMDWNCNGLYNDVDTTTDNNWDSDRILVGYFGNEIIFFEPSAGASILLPETYVDIRGRIYKVIEVEPTGKYLILRPTDKTSSILRIGDDLPDLRFALMSGDTTSLLKVLVKGKYNLIDIWAYWCSGCVKSIPKLKMLDSVYSEKLNIIALHDWNSNDSIARKCVEKNNISWTNGFLTPEISKKLLASGGFPYYLLVDPNGKMYKFNVYLGEVEILLKKLKD